MAISSVTSATDAALGAAAMKKATGMNKDDFLKLFVTQLQHQDPLNPQDGNEFIAQLAQLSQVEQAYNTNSNLAKMLTAQSNATVFSAVSFIGKQITAEGSEVTLAAGKQTDLSFKMNYPVTTGTVEIRDAAGALVRTITIPATTGESSVTWDGKKNDGSTAADGVYSFKVVGKDAAGNALTAKTYTTGTVDAVDLNADDPVLMAGGVRIPLSTVLKVKGVV